MLSRAKIEHDTDILREELQKLLHVQAERLETVRAEPGSQVHYWQSILANRGNFDIPGATQIRADIGQDNADKLRLQCLIRGAQLNDDTAYSSVVDMAAAMAGQQAETLWCQAATEYSRAAEMYSYVAVTLRSHTKVAPAPAQHPKKFTRAADATKASPRTMRRIQDKLEQAKSTVKKAAQQEFDARQQTKAASQAAAPETSQEAVISHELIRQHQGRDAAVLSIRKALQYTGPEALPIRWREALAKDFELDQQETLVKIKINPDGSSRRVLVIPESLVQRALYSCHGGYDCGHPGFLRSYQALYDKYHWSGMYAMFSNAVYVRCTLERPLRRLLLGTSRQAAQVRLGLWMYST